MVVAPCLAAPARGRSKGLAASRTDAIRLGETKRVASPSAPSALSTILDMAPLGVGRRSRLLGAGSEPVLTLLTVLTVLGGVHVHFDRPDPGPPFANESNLNAQGAQGSLRPAEAAGELAWIFWPAQVLSRVVTCKGSTSAKKV